MGRFTNPRDLYFGEGARHEVKNLKGKKAIIVSGGSSMRRGGFLQDVENDLKEGGFEVKLFEGVESDPSIETVMKGAEAMREFEPDWIIAIGGGSPIDAAKAMWVFYEYPEESFDNIIQPFSFTPSVVWKVKNSFCGTAYPDNVCFNPSLVISVLSVLPELSFSVTSIGVFKLENLFM